MTSPLLKRRNALHLLKLVQRLQRRVLVPEHPSLDKVGQESLSLVRHMLPCRYSKDIVEFLKRVVISK